MTTIRMMVSMTAYGWSSCWRRLFECMVSAKFRQKEPKNSIRNMSVL